MKKNYVKFALVAVVASVMFAGCGSSKSTVSLQGEVVELDICEKMAAEKPATRAVGIGTHFNEMTARNIAEAQARAQFARALSAKIKAATSEEALGYDLYSGDNSTGDGGSVTDQGSKSNDWVNSTAANVIAGTVIIQTSKRILPNKQYKVFVCLESQKGVQEMAASIAKQVAQRIPDEQKLKMNFEFEQYRKRVEEELRENR